MIQELRRGIFNKWNIVIVIFIVTFMFLNAYYSGWKTGLSAMSASDILNLEDKIYFAQYFGNTYIVWFDAFYSMSIFAPILLIIPYIFSYREELNNKFRYLMIARKGYNKYILTKFISILISGLVVVIFSELLFYCVTYFFTYDMTNPELFENFVRYRLDWFQSNPFGYFVHILLLRYVYYIAILVFGIGITSFIKSKIAIIVTPFLTITILDVILPKSYAPITMIKPYSYDYFNYVNFAILTFILLFVGISAFVLNEKVVGVKG